jgi:hypothetical protein
MAELAARRDRARPPTGPATPGTGLGQAPYAPHLERFLSQGSLLTRAERYVVLERRWLRTPAAGRIGPRPAPRAIGCLVCGALSWAPYDVARRYCVRCKVYHDGPPRWRDEAEAAP